MDLYEYQGKELFRRFGIPVSEGRLVEMPEDALAAADELGGPVVVKAQVLTGGRGKGGGGKLAQTPGGNEGHADDNLRPGTRGHVVGPPWVRAAARDRKGE